ncbi:MAG: AAA family ATPase [Campylobacterota bacterium]|nr:AAA family ATPase [Campylobacterota bacterium]
MSKLKKIPYGLADYKNVKEENFYFIDKTPFIEKLEDLNESFLIFLRPRRFGKSMFISMLHYYYDRDYKDNFETLYGDTYIGKHPTKNVNKYLIMRFNFSAIDVNDVQQSFKIDILNTLNSFIRKYKLSVENNTNPMILFNNLFTHLKEEKLELMILIDEYDNFANKLLLREKSEYLGLVSEKTASFKQFFTILKTATDMENSPLKRMFITGVTPMTMFDVTSGFNIGSNISLDANLNDMVGFNEEELDEILNYYKIDVDKDILKEWYNNYNFSEDTEQKVFNTDMILYFINKYQKSNKLPKEMIDINVRSDYSKLRNIVYTNKKLNGNFETLQALIAGDSVSVSNLVQDFSALKLEEMNNFKSLMFYLGLVTIKDRELDLNLKIPNETVKRIDIDFLRDTLSLEKVFKLNINKLEEYLKEFALNGSLEIFRYLAQMIKENTGIRDYIYKEQSIKSMYIAYLSLTPYFIAKSELELNKGFVDILIKPFNPYVKYMGLLEFKYIKRNDKADKQTIEKLKKEAIEQLDKYEDDSMVTTYTKDGVKLKKVVLIFHGWELKLCEEIEEKSGRK